MDAGGTEKRTIIVTRELFPKHPPKGSRFSGQEDYEEYLKHYTGQELTITKEEERGAKEAGYFCFLDYYIEMVVDD
ncbi:hypothetical protein KFL_002260140 [Klebsormidium nitens]|uniref:Uncharacterized protein n=1 Tax=Klebsormidium nitens TaxID=105231 RepID=A0A1Y1IAX9_KLENI|nr:hypothetical protein KFL_002260140 [Klebsormidium nitens]|eukprot:GAQ85258.1 hypothetical protein KFL_002260140 [Klebsormidium nitens]